MDDAGTPVVSIDRDEEEMVLILHAEKVQRTDERLHLLVHLRQAPPVQADLKHPVAGNILVLHLVHQVQTLV